MSTDFLKIESLNKSLKYIESKNTITRFKYTLQN